MGAEVEAVRRSRQNTAFVALLVAVLGPKVKQLTGYELTFEDGLELLSGGLVLWHGIVSLIERFLPPPAPPANPTPPATPAGDPPP